MTTKYSVFLHHRSGEVAVIEAPGQDAQDAAGLLAHRLGDGWSVTGAMAKAVNRPKRKPKLKIYGDKLQPTSENVENNYGVMDIAHRATPLFATFKVTELTSFGISLVPGYYMYLFSRVTEVRGSQTYFDWDFQLDKKLAIRQMQEGPEKDVTFALYERAVHQGYNNLYRLVATQDVD